MYAALPGVELVMGGVIRSEPAADGRGLVSYCMYNG